MARGDEGGVDLDREKREIRRYQRYHGYDYSRGAVLFVTIVTDPRRPLFGRVVGDKVALNDLGLEVEKAIVFSAEHTNGLRLYEHVVMPDHVHLRVYLEKGLPEPLKTVGSFVRRFKTWTTRCWKLQAGLEAQDGAGLGKGPEAQDGAGRRPEPCAPRGGLWQQGYHDYICVSRDFIDGVIAYIGYNATKWDLMYSGKGLLRIHEPLCDVLLPDDSYWKGIGRVDLLDGSQKLCAVRISRRVAMTDVPGIVARIMTGVGKGWVVISTFLSPGERELYAELARRGAAFVHVKSTRIPIVYRPTIRETPLFAANKLLVIGRQTDEREIKRENCLELNDAISTMAVRGGGCAIYARAPSGSSAVRTGVREVMHPEDRPLGGRVRFVEEHVAGAVLDWRIAEK